MNEESREKLEVLRAMIARTGPMAVAFSSGVDSTLLLKVAADVLGGDVIAVTARSRSFPERENREAAQFCRELGVKQVCVDVDQLSIEGFRENPPDRCYICKKELFGAMIAAAKAHGFSKIAEGSNMDDLGGKPVYTRRRSGRFRENWDFPPGRSSLLHASPHGLYTGSTSRMKSWREWTGPSSC